MATEPPNGKDLGGLAIALLYPFTYRQGQPHWAPGHQS